MRELLSRVSITFQSDTGSPRGARALSGAQPSRGATVAVQDFVGKHRSPDFQRLPAQGHWAQLLSDVLYCGSTFTKHQQITGMCLTFRNTLVLPEAQDHLSLPFTKCYLGK